MLAGRGRSKIRPPRRGLTTPGENVDFEATWAVLSSSLREIHTKNASKLSFEELYRNAYKLVLKMKGEILYERVKAFEQEWLSTEVRKRIEALLSPNILPNAAGGIGPTAANERRVAGERFLRGLKEVWEDHNICMNMTTDVLMYMDRVYCADHHRPSIFAASMALFRDHILRSPLSREDPTTIAMVLYSVILDQIRMEREGDIIDKNLIRSCAYMLEGLYETDEEEESTKLYLTTFEPEFLDESRKFYQEEGDSLLRDSDAGTYCRHTRRRIVEERDRCRSTLSLLTAPKIISVVEDELIRRKIHDVVEMEGSGVKHMLDNDRLEDLELVYELDARVDPKKEELRKALQRRVVELGSEINKAAATASQAPPAPAIVNAGDKSKGDGKPPVERVLNQQTVAAIKWVDDVLQLKDKYDHIWRVSFRSDQGLQTALTRSFSDFINLFPRSSEYISLFLDENLKKGLKGKTENEVDAVLEKAIILIRYVQDKDMFERYYKKHLSRRLLSGKSVSNEVEKQMISRMKMEIGNHFTQKLEGMFKDMTISEDLTANYKAKVAQLGDPDPKRIELSINVLTSTMWPLDAMAPASRSDEGTLKCIFPPEVERIKQGFEKFYFDKHNGRVLIWQANMGSADIRATFSRVQGKEPGQSKERRHELNVSTYSMVVLLLFNDMAPGESMTFEDIQAKTNIPTPDLIRNLQSLAVAPKTRILVKEPMSKDVKPTDKFSFNENFQSKFLRVKVNIVSSGNKVEGSEERKETEKKNNDSRGNIIEAAIVRIMKQRKELSHQQLISEVISQLASRFMPDVNMVKKRIESLIEREYIERMEDVDRPAYRYLA